MENNKYANYLLDLGDEFKERALEAKKKLENVQSENSDKDFAAGVLHAYYCVISMMQSRADIFEIDLREMKLDDIDPDKDLL